MSEVVELFEVDNEDLDVIVGGCPAPYCHNGA